MLNHGIWYFISHNILHTALIKTLWTTQFTWTHALLQSPGFPITMIIVFYLWYKFRPIEHNLIITKHTSIPPLVRYIMRDAFVTTLILLPTITISIVVALIGLISVSMIPMALIFGKDCFPSFLNIPFL